MHINRNIRIIVWEDVERHEFSSKVGHLERDRLTATGRQTD